MPILGRAVNRRSLAALRGILEKAPKSDAFLLNSPAASVGVRSLPYSSRATTQKCLNHQLLKQSLAHNTNRPVLSSFSTSTTEKPITSPAADASTSPDPPKPDAESTESSSSSEGGSSVLSTIGTALKVTAVVVAGSFLCVYLSDSRAGVYSAVVMPLVHWLVDPESAHRFAILLGKFGLVPRERVKVDDETLHVK
ncbi:hypothetical protein HK102_001615, partial [Quaeritorhiza haematococci]